MKFYFKLLSITGIFLLACGFSYQHNYRSKEAVERAMKKYDNLILKMDVDSIALLYMPDGDLGNIAHGRDSIRNFLNRFRNFKVLYQSSVPDSFSIRDDTAFLKGEYHQKTIMPPKDTVSVKGRYRSEWIWTNGSGWHIQHMETFPAK